MRKKSKIVCKTENLKPNLKLFIIYFNDDILSMNLSREYLFDNEKRVFEIYFSSDEKFKLKSEVHYIDNQIQKEYACDTSISPSMFDVYKYLHGEKIR